MSYRDISLIGFDSSLKNKDIIFKAYNNETTFNFILNILTHLKREFNLDLNENDFAYEPIWNQDLQRVEMYLTPKCETRVRSEREEIV